jgi:hypothetical protein
MPPNLLPKSQEELEFGIKPQRFHDVSSIDLDLELTMCHLRLLSVSDYVIPASIIEQTEWSRNAEFDYNKFIQERCLVDKGLVVEDGLVYAAYREWSREQGVNNFDDKTKFIHTMKDRFSYQNERFYGLTLK